MLNAQLLNTRANTIFLPDLASREQTEEQFQVYNDLLYVTVNDKEASDEMMQKIFFRQLLSQLLLEQGFVNLDETKEAIQFYIPHMSFNDNLYEDAWREVKAKCIARYDEF